ncbi:MAG: cytochrome c oxidase subunit II [Acidimicrobiales bacterium]
MATPSTTQGGSAGGPRHGVRIAVIWAVVAVVSMFIMYFVVGPLIPPGTMSSSATGQQFDAKVLSTLGIFVMTGVLTFFGYSMIVFRQPKGAPITDGPPLHGHAVVQSLWIGITSAMVMGLAIFGTYELVVPAGAGSGEGPSPIWKPSAKHILPVQVIAQQWRFTYRYPTYGGFETSQLVLPTGTDIQFNVTSLDVIHSFWAYQLGVKADANPGVNNVAYTKVYRPGKITVRCAELCGIWHGAMYDYGKAVSPAAFRSWATATEHRDTALTKTLPKYSLTYTPSCTGAGGGYYPSQDPFGVC